MSIIIDFLKRFIGIFTTMKFPVDYIDIIVVAVIIYFVIKFAMETRTGQLIRGILIILALYQFAIFMHFSALVYILKNTIQLSFIAILIIFQPELRSSLERIGRVKFSTIKNMQSLGKVDPNEASNAMINAVCESCKILSASKIGALMVLERSAKLGDIIDTGMTVDAEISPQTLITIFFPNTPLHDGAVIIRENRIASAGCLLPLSKSLQIDKELGTCHRAAIGITEASDAIAVVVSEETGNISVAMNGKINVAISKETLKDLLVSQFIVPEKKKGIFGLFKKEETNNEN